MTTTDDAPKPWRRAKIRSFLALTSLFLLWLLLLVQSFETSWSFTEHAFPPERVWRYEPLRDELRGVSRVDLYAGFDQRKRRRQVFWRAQFILAPTVLKYRDDADIVLKRAGEIEPHFLVVEFPSHSEFVHFRRRYEDVTSQNDRVTRVQDLGNGLGLIVSRRED